MAVTVKTAAEHRSLTTVAAVKDVLGVSSSKFDSVIDRFIKSASQAVEDYSGHTFARQTYVETVAGADHPILSLTHVPIIGTPTVTTDGDPIVDFVVQDPDAGFLYREVGWARSAWIGWGVEDYRIPTTEELNFSVEYEAGYYLPEDTDRDLPYLVEQACIETVVAWYSARRQPANVKSKKVGDLSITYADEAARTLGIPASARALLSRRLL